MQLPNISSAIHPQLVSLIPTLNKATFSGVLWRVSGSGRSGRFWLDVPGVASYLVENGESILVAPSGGDEAAIQRFLSTTPLAALLYQQGMLAMHAAVISFGENEPTAILLAGDSGTGKSTLLAALAQQGGIPLCDDLAPVGLDEQGRVVVYANPGPLRLWLDAQQNLGISNGQNIIIGTARPELVGYPLRAIYWLAVQSKDSIDLQPIQGVKRFEAAGKLSYNTHIADALLERPAYFKIAAAIARQVPIFRLHRPRGRWSVDELAQKILLNLPADGND